MTTVDLHRIAVLLAVDPIWSVYAIADLQPAMAPYCRWRLHDDGPAHAVALIFDGLEPPILFAAGDPDALVAALRDAPLPKQVYLSVREEHAAAVSHWYDHHDVRRMWRMVLRGRVEERGSSGKRKTGSVLEQTVPNPQSPISPSFDEPLHLRTSALKDGFRLRRLTGVDAPAVKALFAHGGPFTPDAFAAHQIESGVFYGVEYGAGELLAVGGTHIVDDTARVAAIGNMYTHPDCRGQGFASVVLGAIVTTLRANAIEMIALNVDQRNVGARRIYERFGFVVHCPFIEGVATLKTMAP
ncbi:MAG: GNAT family N-acetyltransferase [Caldilinea sp.]|nr:GNAT family N-acetyltransferase [Caldilinea sp.]